MVRPSVEIMATVKFRIPYPSTRAGKTQWARDYGVNAYYSGKHWAQRKQDADYWHWLTTANMDAQDVRRIPLKKPVYITFRWHDGLDVDNHAIMGKMIADALKGRVIENDDQRYVRGVSHFVHDKDYISVEIREV